MENSSPFSPSTLLFMWHCSSVCCMCSICTVFIRHILLLYFMCILYQHTCRTLYFFFLRPGWSSQVVLLNCMSTFCSFWCCVCTLLSTVWLCDKTCSTLYRVHNGLKACRLSWGGLGFEYSCLLFSTVGAWMDSSVGMRVTYSLSNRLCMPIPFLLDIHLVYSSMANHDHLHSQRWQRTYLQGCQLIECCTRIGAAKHNYLLCYCDLCSWFSSNSFYNVMSNVHVCIHKRGRLGRSGACSPRNF